MIKPTDKNRTPQDSFAVLQSHFQSGRPPYGICLIYGDSGVLSGFENSLKRKRFPRAGWIVREIGKMLMALAVIHHLAISNGDEEAHGAFASQSSIELEYISIRSSRPHGL